MLSLFVAFMIGVTATASPAVPVNAFYCPTGPTGTCCLGAKSYTKAGNSCISFLIPALVATDGLQARTQQSSTASSLPNRRSGCVKVRM